MFNDKTRSTLMGIVVVLIVILLAIYFIRKTRVTPTVNNSPLPTPVSQFQQDLKDNFGIVVPNNALKADLKDITGAGQMGLVTLDKTTGQNVYTIIANLEDPAQGYFYQAWLVNGNDIISLGQLSNNKGGWIVNFSSQKNLEDHKTVWVTLERYFDITPEKHILEGSFQ